MLTPTSTEDKFVLKTIVNDLLLIKIPILLKKKRLYTSLKFV